MYKIIRRRIERRDDAMPIYKVFRILYVDQNNDEKQATTVVGWWSYLDAMPTNSHGNWWWPTTPKNHSTMPAKGLYMQRMKTSRWGLMVWCSNLQGLSYYVYYVCFCKAAVLDAAAALRKDLTATGIRAICLVLTWEVNENEWIQLCSACVHESNSCTWGACRWSIKCARRKLAIPSHGLRQLN